MKIPVNPPTRLTVQVSITLGIVAVLGIVCGHFITASIAGTAGLLNLIIACWRKGY